MLGPDGQEVKSFSGTGGYIKHILRIFEEHLNLTAVLTITKGWGVQTNGTWNGMVGVLYRKVKGLN